MLRKRRYDRGSLFTVNYDPKLKDCVEEIETIMRKYDCGGLVTLHSKSHGEFKIIIPKWSLAKYEVQENSQLGFRIKVTKEELTQNKSLKKDLESTISMILGIKDISARSFLFMEELEKKLREKIEIENHVEWAHQQ